MKKSRSFFAEKYGKIILTLAMTILGVFVLAACQSTNSNGNGSGSSSSSNSSSSSSSSSSQKGSFTYDQILSYVNNKAGYKNENEAGDWQTMSGVSAGDYQANSGNNQIVITPDGKKSYDIKLSDNGEWDITPNHGMTQKLTSLNQIPSVK